MTSVQRESFGTLPGSGETVERFRLHSSSVTVEVLSLGCIITALKTPDKAGRVADIVLGFDNLENYLSKHPYFGAVIGRVANRIAKGKFTVEGKEYQLAINNGPNSIHGGIKGFDKMLWNAEVLPNSVRFSRISPDGEEGYPGELKVWVTYTLDEGELSINYRAQTDKTTPINLTNHSYFNLAGQGSQNIYDHEVCIAAEEYLPVDDTMIPTVPSLKVINMRRQYIFSVTAPQLWNSLPIHSREEHMLDRFKREIACVHDTLFDLRKPVKLGRQMEKLGGYDHNFCLDFSKDLHYCARVWHPDTGRVLEVSTTQPGLQFYTANFLDGSLKGKGGAVYPSTLLFVWKHKIGQMLSTSHTFPVPCCDQERSITTQLASSSL